jgi:uncharacterized damage-inducible protein DinB
MHEQLVDTWRIHNRINLFLVTAIDPAALHAELPFRGRTVAEQVGHMHHARLIWLKAAAPDLLGDLAKIERGADLTREHLVEALTASGHAMELLLERGLAAGRIKGFKPHASGFLGYLIAHESHHRGQIVLTLKAVGHPIDRKTLYGMWEWGVR